ELPPGPRVIERGQTAETLPLGGPLVREQIRTHPPRLAVSHPAIFVLFRYCISAMGPPAGQQPGQPVRLGSACPGGRVAGGPLAGPVSAAGFGLDIGAVLPVGGRPAL